MYNAYSSNGMGGRQMPVQRGGRAPAPSVHTFPILSVDEITKTLFELGFSLNAREISQPDGKTMQMVYENFVDLLTGISKEELQQPQFDAMSVLEHPELHERSLPQVRFRRALADLFETVGIRDFDYLKDVRSPEYKRTVRNLSALINFTKFREERVGRYTEESVKTDELLDRKHMLQMRHQELQTRLAGLKARQAKEKGECEAVQKEAEALYNNIGQLNETQKKRTVELRDLKAQDAELMDQLSTQKMKLHNLKQEVDRLSAQVVHSPDRMRSRITAMNDAVAAAKEAIKERQEQSVSAQERLNAMARSEKDVARCIELMKQCEAEMKRANDERAEVNVLQQALENAGTHMRELDANTARLQAQQRDVDERTKRAKEKHEATRGELKSELEQKRAAKVAADRELLAGRTALNRNQVAMQKIADKIAEENDQHQAEMDKMRRQLDSLVDTVGNYHDNLFNSLTAI